MFYQNTFCRSQILRLVVSKNPALRPTGMYIDRLLSGVSQYDILIFLGVEDCSTKKGWEINLITFNDVVVVIEDLVSFRK